MNQPNNSNCQASEVGKKQRWGILNKTMNQAETNTAVNFINYGYKALSENEEINLLYDDEKNRPYIELYDKVISNIDLYHKDVLEVSSGRGGGASYINRYYSPKTFTGIETTNKLVNFCNSYFNEPGLSFIKANVEELPFENESFDYILNIGASRQYTDLPKFLNEIYRVLRKDSFLIFADEIEKRKLETAKHHLRMAGFTIENKEDFSENIKAFIKEGKFHPNKTKKERIPGFMKMAFSPFTKTKDSELAESLLNGTSVFMSFVLKKVN